MVLLISNQRFKRIKDSRQQYISESMNKFQTSIFAVVLFKKKQDIFLLKKKYLFLFFSSLKQPNKL